MSDNVSIRQANDQMSHSVSGPGGNTRTPGPRSRQWCLTLNNWTEQEKSRLSHLSTRSKWWIIAKEVGENGTPHLQCFFQFKNQVRFSTIKKACPRGHWEKARGTMRQNFAYCSKDNDYESNIIPKLSSDDLKNLVRSEYKDVHWRPWQKDVIDLIDAPVDSRTIFWIYESTGNTGKSFLAKYLVLEHSAVLVQGKGTDILHAVAKTIESGVLPRLIIFDVPRVSQDFISYQALESLKNGCASSGKYEGCQILIPHPHILCFSNSMPKLEKLSRDRWVIYVIKDNQLYEKLF